MIHFLDLWLKPLKEIGNVLDRNIDNLKECAAKGYYINENSDITYQDLVTLAELLPNLIDDYENQE